MVKVPDPPNCGPMDACRRLGACPKCIIATLLDVAKDLRFRAKLVDTLLPKEHAEIASSVLIATANDLAIMSVKIAKEVGVSDLPKPEDYQ